MFYQEKLSFDPQIHQKELYQSWKNFLKEGKLDRNIVPYRIANSWIRSLKNKVDPWGIPASAYLPENRYQEKVKKYSFLINIAKPFMEEIYKVLEESKYVVVLYCPEGYHLLRIGSFADFERAREFKIRPGLCFEEKILGTTGFSLVKRHKRAIKIVGCEHYHSLLHYIVGSYAPIINQNNEKKLIGVIGIAGAKTMPNDHTLGMVLAIAKAIENYCSVQKVNKILSIYGKVLQTTINKISDGIMIIDSNGIVFELNSAAKRIFSLDLLDIIGKHITETIHQPAIENAILKILQSQKEEEEEIELAIKGRKYLTTIKLTQDNKEGLSGAVVFLKDYKYLTKIAKDLSENAIKYNFSDMIGGSQHMKNIRNFIDLVAQGDAPIIIEGESGTGKEVLAHVIHNSSPRKREAFIVVNCSAIPSELFESTCFGHEKGAFTNAYRTHIGKFELADKGTIFLDEIAEMPLVMQVKLLRFLEEKKIERVGSHGRIDADVRVIVATNKDINEEVQRGGGSERSFLSS